MTSGAVSRRWSRPCAPRPRCSRSTRRPAASAALQLGRPDPAELQAGHADIDADFEFDCDDAGRAGYIDTALLGQYAGIQRIAVQVASTRGQRMATLTRPARRIALPR